MNIAQVLWDLINSPPKFPDDPARQDAADAIKAASFHTYIDSRPQGSGDLSVTVTPQSGMFQPSLPQPLPCQISFFDITIWSKNRTNREAAAAAMELGDKIATMLAHFRGNVDGIEVLEIVPDGAALHTTSQPRDASDEWTTTIQYNFTVTHEQVRGDTSAYG